MADALKNFFSVAVVEKLALALAQAAPTFPKRAFIKDANSGLEELELLGRGKHIAAALSKHLPKAYPEAVAVLLRSLGPEPTADELGSVGMAPFFYLPHTLFVAEHGLEHFELSMHAHYELTKRFTAEFSIRPYIALEPERTFVKLHEWSRDSDARVRRLVSEGTRLRLPWASRVAWLDAHPERVLALLELLKDDASSVVRRSVANNLNDLSKVHPNLVTATCEAWLKNASTERRALVEHALRSAVKRGEAGALRLLGFGKKPAVEVQAVQFAPPSVTIGEQVTVSFRVRNTARTAQMLLVDVAVHFVKANGKGSPKVFKLKRVNVPAGADVMLQRKVSLAVHTTRKPYPGKHAVDVLINGVAFPAGAFQVVAARELVSKRR